MTMRLTFTDHIPSYRSGRNYVRSYPFLKYDPLTNGISSARGNTSLETAVSLTKSLRYDIQALGQKLAEANSQPSGIRTRRSKEDIKAVMEDMKAMLNRIEDVCFQITFTFSNQI